MDSLIPPAGQNSKDSNIVTVKPEKIKGSVVFIKLIAILSMIGPIFIIIMGFISMKEVEVWLAIGLSAAGIYLLYCAWSLYKMKKWAAIFYGSFAAIGFIIFSLAILSRIEMDYIIGLVLDIFILYSIITNWKNFK